MGIESSLIKCMISEIEEVDMRTWLSNLSEEGGGKYFLCCSNARKVEEYGTNAVVVLTSD